MQDTTLKKIIQDKSEWIRLRKEKQPLIDFKDKINKKTRDFYHSLKEKKPCFILEYKKKSPSLGIIRNNFNLIEISNVYKKYASSVSVLTDEKYFHGNLNFINIVRECVSQPVLCKDFFIDPYQVYLSRYYNADAILLMLSVLNDIQYKELSIIAKKLNMGILTEVNNIEELKRALKLNANIIGINNRNLHDLSIDLNRTRTLSSLIKKDTIIISESGIKKYREIKELSKFVNGFLIGSHLMSQTNLETAVRSIIFGDNKVCGLTRSIDIEVSEKYGAIYGGLIFVKNSPRYITKKTAKNISINRKLKLIGIFQNENINIIVDIAEELSLYGVQLHGQENKQYIDKLRNILPKKINIWKAFSIQSELPDRNWDNVNMYIFDSDSGGSNTSFNWSILNHHILDNVILAGGINLKNCITASKLKCSGLDLNSGVEISPGIKDYKKIKSIFQKLRYG
ncbi:bifunctional indole-3-glycerol-phosphate synthase TrpC/phosphoribosylanthranilate isomerase TrpF [Buchnera aphidicola str. APS (Acyrthosiphon pisum)]|uniref:Tryptophan biosynthesis protein TrpCF n=1 Tax=Buchnera aphidicola subsp. Acyrthosiphon pisum (strain APS) TaxID=107806 RepID=TRPC_BUCAI|nr:bifunctional indole-3-glycerol-phosphate synthase TrpC/phosphoribosylanthranilate isomerase TrpF [Buchnera aphidicola]P57366.1 RecName: Full=Tryptophan biosynthesis protein TrpCF; Includes: RecName: Full=Indole-3-glycerol phosphate synthase; Short=IGPS; Includes: RecName: Full=N-(5'-phospho-ribosyl)anthranilate isomerase; Short=PRAI [Buchnera aphidicola str. APS (Acyrthosiphon pisum)]pir/E84962/ phosphoribosylanthranilate isomerase (EC 5.3.1.24) [imported] - Buchnera sp. (strain APS) [Buchnera